MDRKIKSLVSKRKRRFKEDGYDLDLSYITERLIAMGFPAQSLEGVYRNHIDDVLRFLEERHKDHYRIYNLCSERSYDPAKFHHRVRLFPFADHNPPRLVEIQPLCEDIHDWLKNDKENVSVVHCKAGKGRTGVMICCYLLHSRLKQAAQEALDFYGDKRTFDRKGVTIPSQRRYVEYYAKLVASDYFYNPPFMRLREIRMQAPISAINSVVYLTVSSHDHKGYSSGTVEVRKGCESELVLSIPLDESRSLCGDVKIELRRNSFVRRKDKLFSAWLNTHFIFEEGKKMPSNCEMNTNDRNNFNNSQNNTHNNIRHRGSKVRKHNSFKGNKSPFYTLQETKLSKSASAIHQAARAVLGYKDPSKRTTQPVSAAEDATWKRIKEGGKYTPHKEWNYLPMCAGKEPEEDSAQRRKDLEANSLHKGCTKHRSWCREAASNQPVHMRGGCRSSWEGAMAQEVQVVLTKKELDKANKDTQHKLLPQDFSVEMQWVVCGFDSRVNDGEGGLSELRGGSGSTPSTITPSSSSSDDDDEDDEEEEEEEEEEESDWDSAEGSEVLL